MNDTKAERLARLLNQLAALGFTYAEAQRLRRIQSTLYRWSEAECNGDIYRCEDSGKPCRLVEGLRGNRTSYPIPDRETGALKQLAAIMAAHPSLWSYQQDDPRGCALYVGRKADMRPTGNPIVDKAREWGLTVTMHTRGVPGENGKPPSAPSYVADKFPGVTFDTPEAAAVRYLRERKASIPAREMLPLDQYYSRGIAVCV